ncbi:hypothetical protein ACVGOW_10130 [Pseudonocardia saturnea]
MQHAEAAGLSRRRVLAALALAPVAVAGCAFDRTPDGPDPLLVLADAARADAVLAAAVVAADPGLAERVDPLGAARAEHAAALDAEVARLAGDGAPPPTSVSPAPPAATGLADLRAAVTASAAVAAAAALTLPAERVGLVASISACCATYGTVLV